MTGDSISSSINPSGSTKRSPLFSNRSLISSATTWFARNRFFHHAIELLGMAKLTIVTCPLPRAPRRAPGHGKKVMIVPGFPTLSPK
jgi:hypothetical protein